MMKIKIAAILLGFTAFFLCIASSVLYAFGIVFFDTVAHKSIFWFTMAGLAYLIADARDKGEEKLYWRG